MRKKILFIIMLICLFTFNTKTNILGQNYEYDISGYSEDGEYVYGEVELDQSGGLEKNKEINYANF